MIIRRTIHFGIVVILGLLGGQASASAHQAPPTSAVVSTDAASCWSSMAEVAGRLGSDVPIRCLAMTPEFGDATGYWNGYVVTVLYGAGRSPQYLGEVLAHELGHALAERFTDEDRAAASSMLGWSDWDPEAWADVYAYSVGMWRDYGDGWRHASAAPTADQINALHAAGLLPS